jgi:hypothetical protein
MHNSVVLRRDGFRFFCFSREEPRMHVHVHCQNGEAKFWLAPQIELAKNVGLTRQQLRKIETIIEESYDVIVAAWNGHFGS